jgi:hypothetical protein
MAISLIFQRKIKTEKKKNHILSYNSWCKFFTWLTCICGAGNMLSAIHGIKRSDIIYTFHTLSNHQYLNICQITNIPKSSILMREPTGWVSIVEYSREILRWCADANLSIVLCVQIVVQRNYVII